MKTKILCITCRKRYVDKDSDCINVCSKCLYGKDDLSFKNVGVINND